MNQNLKKLQNSFSLGRIQIFGDRSYLFSRTVVLSHSFDFLFGHLLPFQKARISAFQVLLPMKLQRFKTQVVVELILFKKKKRFSKKIQELQKIVGKCFECLTNAPHSTKMKEQVSKPIFFIRLSSKIGCQYYVQSLMSSFKSKKTKIRIREEFTKSDQVIESQSSHREVNYKKEGDFQAREELNFQRQQMQNIRAKIFFKKVIKRLHALISLSKTPSNMSQEWQRNDEQASNQKSQKNQSIGQIIDLLYPWMRLISILKGICLISIIWAISIIIVFQEKLFTKQLSIFLAIEVLFLIFKVLIIHCNDELVAIEWPTRLKKVLSSFLVIVACGLMLIRNHLDHSQLTITIDMIVGVILVAMSRRVSNYFQLFRVYAENKKVIKELRILEMFCILFVIAHIFGLIIYCSIYITPEGQKNWLSFNSLWSRQWSTKYIYSVYWAITTIATVGYGDLTPQNQVEVVIIVILQICGTSFFGYMINVIGITVDNINKKNVEYDNYQETIAKLKDHYQLSEELCVEMKNDIKKKYAQSDKTVPLKKNEETQLLEFVDSTVKKNFILETNIKIIKKSIFFLTYFTVNFQNEIALKLIRSIYKKDENIQTFDSTTKQRNIVIINHGKVSLFLKKRQNNSVIYKLVRNIEPMEGKPTLNVIGYSNLILNQDIAISAVSNEMTSGYVLKRSDVMQCIDKSLIDYESLHEMRQKMMLISLKESIEAPSLKDSDFHFTPNILILTCRHSKQSKQMRKKKTRRDNRIQLQVDTIKIQLDNDWYSVKKEESESYFDQEHMVTKLIVKKELNQFQSLLSIEEAQPHQDQNPHSNKDSQLKQHLRLDQVKIFEHFMKGYNISALAVQYEKACKTRSYNKRVMTKVIKGRPSVSEKLLKKLHTIKSDNYIPYKKS